MDSQANPAAPLSTRPDMQPDPPPRRAVSPAVSLLSTLVVILVAGLLGWAAWNVYVAAPWTRDGTVRAYVITEASQVAGRLVALPVAADSFVHKGDLLMQIEATDYQIAVANAEASLATATADLENKQAEAKRRLELTTLSTSTEERQTYVTSARMAANAMQQSAVAVAQARTNLDRTRIVSPVNGFVTNLTTQVGDFVTPGQRVMSVVDADSFWVDGYFEETQLDKIHIGDTAKVLLIGGAAPIDGHVAGISRGIEVQNAQADSSGLATVNPIFTWIRLAQRIPIRIELDHVPDSVVLVAGRTASVQIDQTGHGLPVMQTRPVSNHGPASATSTSEHASQ